MRGYPPSSSIKMGFISRVRFGMGSFASVGGRGALGRLPVLVKAPDLAKNLASALMPLFVPSSTGSERCFEAFSSIFLCSLYLGHSHKMWLRVSRVALSRPRRFAGFGLFVYYVYWRSSPTLAFPPSYFHRVIRTGSILSAIRLCILILVLGVKRLL